MDGLSPPPRDEGAYPITELLLAWERGAAGAQERLFSALYDDLRALAHRQRLRYGAHATLNTTALVHELYLKLVDHMVAPARDRGHLTALMTRALRCVLVDYARRMSRQKRGSDARRVDLDDAARVLPAAEDEAEEILALHAALDQLAALDAEMAEVVEMHFFAGLSYAEIAEVRGLNVKAVYRTMAKAKALLSRALGG
jgi:RNA polymerase sigma factor (TIGR02999 family)